MTRLAPRVGVLAALFVVVACVPRLRPLAGTPVAARLPDARLSPGPRRIVFRWELDDNGLVARGEGVARVAPPDSARLDFFLAGGLGAGAAVLVGDSLRAPGPDMVRRLVPPPPLLWASLGRLAVPALPDTVARVDGSTLRADIGRPVSWRLSFRADSLVRVERVGGGRVREWVERTGERVRYRHEGARRVLQLTVTRVDEVSPFDASIWQLP